MRKFSDNIRTKQLESIRIARVEKAVLFAGVSATISCKRHLIYLEKTQLADGGWGDPEETAWAASVMAHINGKEDLSVQQGVHWLKRNHLVGGGWGKHSRDRARIPTTSLVLTLLPEAGCDEDYKWVAEEWAKDLSGAVQLSYKAGFYLLVADSPICRGNLELIDRTISHLVKDQNDDGGFGPWRNHPIGSDPWSTGIVLWGLSKWIDRIDPSIIERALHWLEVTQLPSGYWPYHYPDEGTSYALVGAVSAMRAMASWK